MSHTPATPWPVKLSSRLVHLGMLSSVITVMTGCQLSSTGQNIDGVRNFQTGNHQAAINNFQQALMANPDDADAYYNLAATYHDLGRRNQDRAILNQAEGLYHQCLDLSPDHAECYRGLASLLVNTDRSQSAFTLLQRWIQRNPQSVDGRIELARLHEEFGDKDSAVQYLTDALNVNAANPRAWAALGRIREEKGQLAQALADYQQAYQLNRFQPGIANRIASLNQGLARTPHSTPGNGTQVVTTPGLNTTR